MSYTYANRKRAADTAKADPAAQQSSVDALRSGAVKPTREQMGHRADLPDAMRAKMENAFGADLSAVRLYESEAVGDAGAEAITQGSNIAFAPGMLDFTSSEGQALLGHEISHVVSQSRGEVSQSRGFLNDHALEARADREGAMAAAGQQIAMPTAAMSTATAAPAAGPMQAKKPEENMQISNPTPVAGKAAPITAAAASAPATAAAKHTPPSTPPPPPPAAKQAAAKPAAAETAKAAEPAKKTPPPVPTAPKPDISKMKPAAAPPAKKTPPPVPTAPKPDISKMKPARQRSATVPAKKHTPPSRTPPPPPTRASAAPPVPDADEEGIGFDDVMEAASFLPGQTNEVTDKASDFLEDDDIAEALVKRHGSDRAEKITDSVGAVKDVTGLMTNTMGTISAAKGAKEKIEAVNEAKKTGSEREVRDARFDAADQFWDLGENVLGAAESGTSFAATLAKNAGKTAGRLGADALSAASETMGSIGDWAGVAKGMFGVGKGLYKYKKDSDIRSDMAAGQERLANQQQPLTKNQATLKDMYKMAHMKSSRDVTDDKFDIAESLVDTIGSGAGIAVDSAGPGAGIAVDLLTKLVTTGIGGAKNMVHEYQEDKDQREILDDQLGLSQEVDDLSKGDLAKKFTGIDRKYMEQAVVRGHGAGSGEIGELYNMQARKLTDEYMGMDAKSDAEVGKFSEAARVKMGKEKSDMGIYHAIGGTDTEYDDRDANPFEKQAKKYKEIQDAGGYRKYYGKKISEGASSAWEKTKTGAGKAAGAVKDFATNADTRKKAWESVKAAPGKAWDKIKTGAGSLWDKTKAGASKAWDKTKAGASKAWDKTKTGVTNAASAVKDFATNADTRKKAWESVKAAPGKAWEAVKAAPGKAWDKAKSGAKYAGEVAKFKIDSIKDSHEKAMDQFNENRDSYKQMSWFDRAKWTLQNPLARMRMATKSGQEAADFRLAQKWQADEIYAADEEQKKKKQEP